MIVTKKRGKKLTCVNVNDYRPFISSTRSLHFSVKTPYISLSTEEKIQAKASALFISFVCEKERA